MAARGRHWLALWLVFLLVILGWVVARQTAALALARQLTALRTEHTAKADQRARLEQRIREGESRTVLIPRAERLGLRLPVDSEIIILQVPPSEVH
jgi:cell division protein FtsL